MIFKGKFLVMTNIIGSFPPDTDTPGFEEENKGKPEETK